MLSIKTKDKNLIIPKNIKISITETNPLFSLNKGSNSLNFSLPAINKKFLQPLHKIGISKIEPVEATIQLNSIKKGCLLNFSELTKENYHCNVNLDFGSFFQKIKNKKIRALELGGERHDTANDENQKNCNENDFVLCETKNLNFMDGTCHEENWKNEVIKQNAWTSYMQEYAQIKSPFIYLCYLYEQIFIESGYTITKNCLRENKYFKKIVLYTNVGITIHDDDGLHPILLNEALPDITIFEFIQKIANIINVIPLSTNKQK